MTEDLFTLAEANAKARAARDAALVQVEENANDQWKRLMRECVVAVARVMWLFTSDDVMDRYHQIPNAPVTHDLRALGAIMTRAVRDGTCRKANCASVPSRRASLHASPRTVWESLIYRPANGAPNARDACHQTRGIDQYRTDKGRQG
jgi:hypothetical protein